MRVSHMMRCINIFLMICCCSMNSGSIGKNINPANGFSPALKKKSTFAIQQPGPLLLKQKKAGIKRGRGLHSLRQFCNPSSCSRNRSFHHQATPWSYLHKTTIIYLHLIQQRITEFKSPLDALYEDQEEQK